MAIPTTRLQRYSALALICLVGFGNYFCYDSPEGLEKQIEQTLGITPNNYTSLFSLYSWPNVILCFFGGLLIDHVLGVRIGSVVFLSLLIVGQMFVALGAFTKHFYLMQIGRFIYGLGGESLSVAQNTYVVNWFKDHELNMVFGFQISVSRAGSFLSINVMHPLYQALEKYYSSSTALGLAFLISAMTCVVSLIFAIILAFYDKYIERITGNNEGALTANETSPQQNQQQQEPNSPNAEIAEFRGLSDLKKFKSEYWVICVICASFYVTIFPFIALGSKFFQIKWAISQDMANVYASAIYVIAAVSCPLIGWTVDKVGRNLVFLLAASLLVFLSHTLMAITYITIWLQVLMLGIGYSIMCSALWPLVALVVP